MWNTIQAFWNDLTLRERIYAVLSGLGFTMTLIFNVQYYFQSDAPSVAGWFAGGFETPSGSSISMDLFIGSTAAFIWMYFEGTRLNLKYKWAYIVGGLLIAWSFTFPLFLMMRERHLRNADSLPLSNSVPQEIA